MKKFIALLVFAAVTVMAQSSPSFGMFVGTAPVATSGHPCNSAQNVGSTYTRIANPSVSYVCQQTGASSLGSGAFAWVVSTNGSGNVTLTGTQTLTNKTLTAPVLTTPTLGVASATSINKITITAPATGSTLTIVDGKTVTVNNTITLNGTDSTTLTLPAVSSGITAGRFCGATSGDAACSNASGGGTARVFGGIATLASNAAVISGISPAFTSTSTYTCVANDLTTRANPVQVANTSSSSITITNTTGASDVINYLCFGY